MATHWGRASSALRFSDQESGGEGWRLWIGIEHRDDIGGNQEKDETQSCGGWRRHAVQCLRFSGGMPLASLGNADTNDVSAPAGHRFCGPRVFRIERPQWQLIANPLSLRLGRDADRKTRGLMRYTASCATAKTGPPRVSYR